MKGTGSRNLIALDLVRFACALLVVAFHYGAGFVLLPPPGAKDLLAGMPVDNAWVPFVDSGWIGVELFFVLSGIVIAWSAEGSGSARFLGRRALRLVPAAWLCASLTACALLVWSGLPTSAIVAQWLGSVAFSPMIRPIDPSYWTLAIEVNFYLLVAAMLKRGSTLRHLEWLGIVLGLWSLGYWLAYCLMPVPAPTLRWMHLTLLPTAVSSLWVFSFVCGSSWAGARSGPSGSCRRSSPQRSRSTPTGLK